MCANFLPTIAEGPCQLHKKRAVRPPRRSQLETLVCFRPLLGPSTIPPSSFRHSFAQVSCQLQPHRAMAEPRSALSLRSVRLRADAMAQGAEETFVACRKFPGRAHHSKLRAHEQNNHEQNCVLELPRAPFSCGMISQTVCIGYRISSFRVGQAIWWLREQSKPSYCPATRAVQGSDTLPCNHVSVMAT